MGQFSPQALAAVLSNQNSKGSPQSAAVASERKDTPRDKIVGVVSKLLGGDDGRLAYQRAQRITDFLENTAVGIPEVGYQAGTLLGAGVRDGDAGEMLGGAGMAALGAMPGVRKVAREALNVVKKGQKIVAVPLSAIEHGESAMPGGKLTRPTSRQTIDEYANLPTPFPPIELVDGDTPGKMMVADGSHRLEAARKRGDSHISAVILRPKGR
tara:strand:- start:359 stop:994 length:636 start_codon:yes stop_codon:yes gene_type:complete